MLRFIKLFISFLIMVTVVRFLINPSSSILTVSGFLDFANSAPQIEFVPYHDTALNLTLPQWLEWVRPLISGATKIWDMWNFIATSAENAIIMVIYFIGFIFIA